MDEGLKSCPFCGDDEPVTQPFPPEPKGLHLLADRSPYYLHCETCGADGGGRDTEADAVAAWNTRAEPHPVARLHALGLTEPVDLGIEQHFIEGLEPVDASEVERVARAIAGVGYGEREHHPWDCLVKHDPEDAEFVREQARAAIAALHTSDQPDSEKEVGRG